MTSLITSLHQSLEVTPLDNDQVQVSVILPSDLFNDYFQLLESLTGFVNAINLEKHKAKLKAAADNTQECHLHTKQHHQRIVKDYDGYMAQGLTRNEAIKLISADLRKDDHPWCSVDLVKISLNKVGRPARIGRPRRQYKKSGANK